MENVMHAASVVLAQFGAALADGSIRVVDLTQPLGPSTPVINLPQPFANSPGFSAKRVSNFDADGPAWYWNAFTLGEHTGTHFDAPNHWITGRENPRGGTDTLNVQSLIGVACVLDCTVEAQKDPDFVVQVEHFERWERQHGRIPSKSWVLLRTDWSKRTDPKAFLNDGHVPGPGVQAMKWLSEERDVLGWGVEQVGTDAGLAHSFEPAFPAHHYMHAKGKFGLASLCNLDQLPAVGAIVVAAPLKIEKGSGSPMRALAFVPRT